MLRASEEASHRRPVRCAIYTRQWRRLTTPSTDREDLDQRLPGLGELRAGYLHGAIRCCEADSVFFLARLTGDVAENHVIASESSKASAWFGQI